MIFVRGVLLFREKGARKEKDMHFFGEHVSGKSRGLYQKNGGICGFLGVF